MRPILNRNNKKKIFNDPVYGFISIPDEFIFDLIEHPYMQRLRRIMQLGMSHLVYPGALHTRFHHVLGAMHLMTLAVATIRRKGHQITDVEERAVLTAILLHDIGHGPFSHALEYDIVSGVSHEEISGFFIERLSKEFGSDMDQALLVFKNEHPKPFLHHNHRQLLCSKKYLLVTFLSFVQLQLQPHLGGQEALEHNQLKIQV